MRVESQAQPAVQLGIVIPATAPERLGRDRFLESLDRLINKAAPHIHALWMVDHLQEGKTALLESFTTLSFLAARYPALNVGHMVICNTFRRPALVAKMAATLHFLSGGRYIFGIGAGSDSAEHLANGIPFPSARDRVAQLDEALQIIRALWTQPRVDFEGDFYQLQAAVCAPRPQPLPTMMVGAFRPQMLKLTARHADWWNVSSVGPGELKAMKTHLLAACRQIGRPPPRMTWSGACAIRPTASAARRMLTDDDYALAGTPDDVAAQMRQLIELGVTYFMLDLADFPELTTCELLFDKVRPVCL